MLEFTQTRLLTSHKLARERAFATTINVILIFYERE